MKIFEHIKTAYQNFLGYLCSLLKFLALICSPPGTCKAVVQAYRSKAMRKAVDHRACARLQIKAQVHSCGILHIVLMHIVQHNVHNHTVKGRCEFSARNFPRLPLYFSALSLYKGLD